MPQENINVIRAKITERLLKLIGQPTFVPWRYHGLVSHSQTNRIPPPRNRLPDEFAAVTRPTHTVEPRRLDMIHALVKRVADEVGILGMLGAKADPRKREVRLPQPTQFVMSICASLLRWCL
jgi:hypothetical protein